MDEKQVDFEVGVELDGGGIVTEEMLFEVSNNKGEDE